MLPSRPPNRPAGPEQYSPGKSEKGEERGKESAGVKHRKPERHAERSGGEEHKHPAAIPRPLSSFLDAVGADRTDKEKYSDIERGKHLFSERSTSAAAFRGGRPGRLVGLFK